MKIIKTFWFWLDRSALWDKVSNVVWSIAYLRIRRFCFCLHTYLAKSFCTAGLISGFEYSREDDKKKGWQDKSRQNIESLALR